MNSNYGKGSSSSLNNFNFDFGLGSSRPKSLNDQKNPTSSYSSYSSSTTTQPKPAWQPNKPSWTHQPAPSQPTWSGLNGPPSMVGDISGKSWNSSSSASGIGIVEKNPNLFGDLVTSALGQGNKGNSNAPLKTATPTSNKTAYSMGNLADSLPKTNNSAKSGGTWGSNGNFGSYSSEYNKTSSNVNAAGNGNVNVSSNMSPNLGRPSMKSMMGGSGVGGGMGGNRDPFGSLVDFGSKQQSGNLNAASKSGTNAGDNAFGDFQNAAKPSTTTTFPSGGFGVSNSSFMGSNTVSNSKIDDFGMPGMDFASQKQSPVQTSSGDPLDMFFSSSSGGTATASAGAGEQQFSEVDDWGLDSGFGGGAGNDSGGATTELEGLPPPPAGVTASIAKNKGVDNQKQGQYADAIKWLSWAVVLLEKTGDKASTTEVLSCRASCYKEVGEYKKAVADCTKVLEDDDGNVSILVQRALLYESMEKYKLGAEDLRTVLKIDPTNRIAKSTIHRLTKMVD
ncbi:hypothetical protein JCGZ_18923 [Jatropha curcas]|uniref:Uncharacterized protein n=1 Tax=Jatropha curcas TaxID=180498 RepID=A0A067JYI3_JATCU|nr:uncharacterized PPE family protein PPE62 [Jatropha curcas]KDP27843.1 hypothetical protein JCGZ_18923 [Jatropha curcas]